MPKPLGSICRIRYQLNDGAAPIAPGDLLVAKTGSAYLVRQARPIRRRHPGPPRFALECMRVTPNEPAANRFTLVWDKRSAAA